MTDVLCDCVMSGGAQQISPQINTNSVLELAFTAASVTMGTSKSIRKSKKGATPISPNPPYYRPLHPSHPPPSIVHLHNPRSTIKLRVCVLGFQGAAVSGHRDGAVHGHVLPPPPGQRHEGLSAAAGAVRPTGPLLQQSNTD